MSASAIIMLCIGFGLTWGGAALCLRLALSSRG
jgi:hypothetical protein